jgi:uncharacterized membrane protein
MQAIDRQTQTYPQFVRWAGLAAGGALALYGLSRRSRSGVGLAILGANVAFHSGTQGRYLSPLLQRLPLPLPASWTNHESINERGVSVEHAVTVNRPADELYRYWRNLENLPQIMRHLESVSVLDDRRSHWVAKGPIGIQVEWDAEITVDRAGQALGWRSLEGPRDGSPQVNTTGLVYFTPDPHGEDTIIRVVLKYDPPAGKLGAAVAKIFGEDPGTQIREDLRRFKQVMETSEVPTTRGQSSNRTKNR